MRAEPASLAFGDLVVAYDTAEWTLTARETGFDGACRAAGCRSASVTAWLDPGPADLCRTDAGPASVEGRDGSGRRIKATTLALTDLQVHVTWTDIGCRNGRPPVIRACTVRAGRVHRFETGPGHCRGGLEVGLEGAVLRLLQGLKAR